MATLGVTELSSPHGVAEGHARHGYLVQPGESWRLKVRPGPETPPKVTSAGRKSLTSSQGGGPGEQRLVSRSPTPSSFSSSLFLSHASGVGRS